MKLEDFNRKQPYEAKEDLLKCCGSAKWVNETMKHFPFNSVQELKNISDAVWSACNITDFMESFAQHPKIGQKSLEEKFKPTQDWAENEQSGARNADGKILQELFQANIAYENKFGYIFIVCATGKTAIEMLSILNQRLNNDTEKELKIASQEQNKITHLRIDKLFS